SPHRNGVRLHPASASQRICAGTCSGCTNRYYRYYPVATVWFTKKTLLKREEKIMAGRNFLFVPGPTNVPDRVLRAMVVAMEDHRSSKFPELTRTLFPDLKKLFNCTDGQVFIFPSTGTGAWEASLVNTLSPGDKVLAPRYGQFSTLWIDMMQRLGPHAEVIKVRWGEGARPD